MSGDLITFFAGAVTVGILNGVDRWRSTRAAQRAAAPVDRLAQNLGPRVQQLGEKVARIEGRLGIAPLEGKPHELEPTE